jgi:hypothetical protein
MESSKDSIKKRLPYIDSKKNSDSEKTISESSLYALEDDHQIDLDDRIVRIQIDQKETSHFLQ